MAFFYLSEFHPITWIYGDYEPVIELDYFHNPEGERFGDGEEGSYADLNVPTRKNATIEWAHTSPTSSRPYSAPVFDSSFCTSTTTRCSRVSST